MRRLSIFIGLAVGLGLASMPARAQASAQQDRIAVLFKQAEEAEQAQNLFKADDLYRSVLKLDPTIAEVWANLGADLYYGEQYRDAIAALHRALALKPSLIIADEPTTALDVIVEAQILKQLSDLKAKYSLSLILITHNMGIVAEMADRVAVMYAGRLAEVAPSISIFERPKHPYTQALLESIPNILTSDKILKTIPGSPPDLTDPPSGCPFHPRCRYVFDRCRKEVPMLVETGDESAAACFLLEGETRHS